MQRLPDRVRATTAAGWLVPHAASPAACLRAGVRQIPHSPFNPPWYETGPDEAWFPYRLHSD